MVHKLNLLLAISTDQAPHAQAQEREKRCKSFSFKNNFVSLEVADLYSSRFFKKLMRDAFDERYFLMRKLDHSSFRMLNRCMLINLKMMMARRT